MHEDKISNCKVISLVSSGQPDDQGRHYCGIDSAKPDEQIVQVYELDFCWGSQQWCNEGNDAIDLFNCNMSLRNHLELTWRTTMSSPEFVQSYLSCDCQEKSLVLAMPFLHSMHIISDGPAPSQSLPNASDQAFCWCSSSGWDLHGQNYSQTARVLPLQWPLWKACQLLPCSIKQVKAVQGMPWAWLQDGCYLPEQIVGDITHVDIQRDHGHQRDSLQCSQLTPSGSRQLCQLLLHVVKAAGQVEPVLELGHCVLHGLAPHNLVHCGGQLHGMLQQPRHFVLQPRSHLDHYWPWITLLIVAQSNHNTKQPPSS